VHRALLGERRRRWPVNARPANARPLAASLDTQSFGAKMSATALPGVTEAKSGGGYNGKASATA